MNGKIEDKLKTLTTKPGVYVMKNKSGEIIYIGKAKNLKNRVSQYFRNSPKQRKVQAMVDNVDDFEYFIANSELDALGLESNLIHKHQPFYNILLKDGKAFPYIKIDMKEEFPRLEIVRKIKKNDGAKYFGPYFAGIDPREILKTVSYAFKLRTCKSKICSTKPAKRECLNFSMGLCLAPCTGKTSKENYMQELSKVINFLNGNDTEIEKILIEKMTIASNLQNFERAIELRECLKMLEKLKTRIVANLPKDVNKDVFAYHTDGLNGVITSVIVRGGKILGVRNFEQSDASLEESETLFNFLCQYYSDNIIPNEIIVSHTINEQLLKDFFGKSFYISSNPIAANLKLLNMAKENAQEHLEKHLEKEKLEFSKGLGALQVLQEKLHLKSLPRRMECFDISHISGSNKVASMVVFKSGKPDKKSYRKFKIKTVEGNNDFESLKETLTRRLQRFIDQNGESFKEKPDLIVIDGGKGQLSSCYEILKSFNLENKIEMISLAERIEEVFLPNNKTPIILKYASAELRLLQNLRDEAHRFAITFHRSLRAKSQVKSELENIKGLGKTKISALLKAFGTTENVKNASIEELCLIKGIHESLAIDIKKHFKKLENLK
ncbi:MAG: excinuclease ABC subunit UvrC [Clostridia bacterium]|nr:excinuclease ABC subunit UvrC [Clostridia bacterium]